MRRLLALCVLALSIPVLVPSAASAATATAVTSVTVANRTGLDAATGPCRANPAMFEIMAKFNGTAPSNIGQDNWVVTLSLHRGSATLLSGVQVSQNPNYAITNYDTALAIEVPCSILHAMILHAGYGLGPTHAVTISLDSIKYYDGNGGSQQFGPAHLTTTSARLERFALAPVQTDHSGNYLINGQLQLLTATSQGVIWANWRKGGLPASMNSGCAASGPGGTTKEWVTRTRSDAQGHVMIRLPQSAFHGILGLTPSGQTDEGYFDLSAGHVDGTAPFRGVYMKNATGTQWRRVPPSYSDRACLD